MKIINSNEIIQNFYEKIEFESLESVSEIIDAVKTKGDSAAKEFSKKFGDGDIEKIEVSREEIEDALNSVSKETLNAIKTSIQNVRQFAQDQLGSIKNLDTTVGGAKLGHRIIPIEKVGCYIPGGNYPLPSSAIMTAVPAKVAGVRKIVACSPKIQPVTIAACELAGVDKIYRIGGVQAIAAVAYGTESVIKVDKIVGPGNKYVTAAKKQVFGECGIDFLAGPSEVLIVADESANPEFIAADMLAQCEHDLDARAFLLTTSRELAESVQRCADNFLKSLKTSDIASKAFEKSTAIIVKNIDEAIEISNNKAPEHLEICLNNSEEFTDKFTNYGSLFIGNFSAEVLGDYCSGTNHVLPTNQVARYSGGLSVFDFIKIQTYQKIDKQNCKAIAEIASKLAEEEGLFAHKLSADLRKEK